MNLQKLRALIERLDKSTAIALENAAAFANTRMHFEVTIEHLLIKLMEQENTGLPRIFHFFKVNDDDLWQQALESLTKLRAGNQSKPNFSNSILDLLERAWNAVTLYYHGDKITTLAILDALIETAPQLPSNQWVQYLAPISLDQLRSHYQQFNINQHKKITSQKALQQDAGYEEILQQFTEDLTAKAKQQQIDPILGRDNEIRLMIDILMRRRKNNPILVGEPGVGKTAVVEGLANAIVAGEVPQALKNIRLLVLDLGLLQAGAGVKGEFEKRLKQVIDAVKHSTVPVILFIDEAHTLIGAGGNEGGSDAANLLKPALARGELRTIAATTWSEYKKYFERDAALARRFQLIKVEEPNEANAMIMLNGLKPYFEKHHKVLITDAAIKAAVQLSNRYITGRQLPDKAVDLIDTACARIRLGQAIEPAFMTCEKSQINYLKQRIEALKKERNQGVKNDKKLLQQLKQKLKSLELALAKDQNRLSKELKLVSEINNKREKISTKQTKASEKQSIINSQNKLTLIQGNKPMMHAEVNATAIADIVADWTGIPVGKMLSNEMQRLLALEETLGRHVLGQSHAINTLCQSIRTTKIGLGNPNAPLGVFMLVGPSGVGKTETARALAEELLGGQRFLVTINMNEYQEAHTVSQLKGSPPGYVGYGEGGILTEAVRQQPYSVVLLDEVEKAHPDVMNLFYQTFDRGFMRDGEGREIDFRNTIILMTSNLGSEAITDVLQQQDSKQKISITELRDLVEPVLSQHFATALLARMQVIPYVNLAKDAIGKIVRQKLKSISKRLMDNHQMQLLYDDKLVAFLSEIGVNPQTGARFINALIEQQLLPEIARQLLAFRVQGDSADGLKLKMNTAGQIECDFFNKKQKTRKSA